VAGSLCSEVITAIEFRRFRVLREATLPLGPCNVLIGPNGSGKTCALQAVQSLRRLAALPPQFGPPPPPGAEEAALVFRFAAPQDELVLHVRGDGIGAAGAPPTVWLEGAQGGQRWPMLRAWIAGIRGYALEPAELAKPAPPGRGDELDPDGSNLPNVLERLERNQPEQWLELGAEFCAAMPEFEAVGTAIGPDGRRRVRVRHTGASEWIEGDALSHGTLAVLALLALAHQRPAPSLLCLEEVDRGLHPRRLRLLRDVLARLSYPAAGEGPAVQTLVTTHSPFLLDLFRDEPEEIVVAEKRGGSATFRRLSDSTDLTALRSGASLGDLWFSGVLGGVPMEE
jgi:predicted ATPase